MTGIRNKKRPNPFVQIDKNMLSDSNISWKAKGILSYLLSKPDEWITYVADIEKRSTDGKDSVRSGMKELEDAGYIERKRIREKGKFKGWEYHVYEYPVQKSIESGKPDIGKTGDGKAENGNSDIGKTNGGESDTSNNDCSNNDFSNNDFKNNNDNAGAQKEPAETPFSFYEKNGFGILTPHVGEKIGAWMDDINEELVIHAMKISVENGVPRWTYAETILRDWQNKKITSVDQVVAAEAKRQQEKNSSVKKPFGSSRKERVPEWLEKSKKPEQEPTPDDDFDVEAERRKLLEELQRDAEKGES